MLSRRSLSDVDLGNGRAPLYTEPRAAVLPAGHRSAGRGLSFPARGATVSYSHPDIGYVPVPDLAPDQVCLATAATRTAPVLDDCFAAAQAKAEITAACGNHEMRQLANGAVSKRG
jgi:hypothetical protein